ncbi:alpha/beta fold hydrolase [Mesobacillus harenae]|uniref:alpha/beta fold hydrolase n=1 Tax=Mesobacillus harenae TaxID=2213203 RepID=UPI0015805239|nr:alpha/beta hydrolase [Mesobacillus harenae]
MKETVSFIEEIVEISGVKTHVYTAGEGEPLLWMHGAGGITSILKTFEELARNYKVYLVDHPGFGLSEKKEERFIDFTDYNYFYRDFLDHYSLDKVHLVGHSLGGRMAVEFAISHPHRVNKLVLISASGLYIEGVKRTDIFIHQPEKRPALYFYNPKYAEDMLRKEKSEEEKSIEVKNLTMFARLTWEKSDNRKFPFLLRYVTAPTCIIWGENDEVLPVEHGKVFEEHIQNAKLYILQKCGHIPHVEQEEQCIGIIQNFLTV